MIDWLNANWSTIAGAGGILALVMALSRIIVSFTKNTTDDRWVAYITDALKAILGMKVKE